MGTPIPNPIDPPPVPPGSLCTTCWGLGKPFGHTPTPSAIRVSVAGIEKADNWYPYHGEPLNGSFVLPQVSVCTFELFLNPGIDDSRVTLYFASWGTAGIVYTTTGEICFGDTVSPICSRVLVNRIANYFINGRMTITIPREG